MNKILVLDIETKPATAYVWRTFKENVGYEQILDPGGIICVAAKFVGEDKVFFFSEWTHSHSAMLRGIYDLICKSDAVVTYNGDKFDLPKLRGEFLLDGLPPPPQITSIDVLKSIRKFGFLINRLAFIGPLLRVGDKVKHEGFSLWAKVMQNDPDARQRMMDYNIQDVILLEELYLTILPYITNHPTLGEGADKCGACNSTNIQHRGYRRTKAFKIQRIQCQDCGSWSDGKKEKA